MSALTATLRLVVDAGLGVWLGSMTFFSFVAAPQVFETLERETAGRVVNAIFPRYYVVGVGLGVVALVAALALVGVGQAGPAAAVLLGVTVLALVVTAYARWSLIPRMERAGDDAFERYHRQSVVLNGVAMLAVAVALVAAHV